MMLARTAVCIFALALSVSGSFLEVIPNNGISEGNKIVIKCSEIFPYGIQSSSRLAILQNSSNFIQSAFWKLAGRRLMYGSMWNLPRTVKKSVHFSSVYTLTYEFVASYKHNRMEIQCLSSRTSRSRAPRKIIFVQKLPEILSCSTNPPQIIGRPITLRCWIVLGSPQAKKVDVEAGFDKAIVGRSRQEYQTDTKFSYRIALMSWIITPRVVDDDLSFVLILNNDVAKVNKTFQLKAKNKREKPKNVTIVDDPTAVLVVTPGNKPGQNLHENDIITCQVVNSTVDWKVELTVKFAKSNDTLTKTSDSNAIDYVVPKTAVGNFMSYRCFATADGVPSRDGKDIAKWVYPSTHRSFLNVMAVDPYLSGANAKADCVFLPGTGKSPIMNLSIVTSNNRVNMKASFDGDTVTQIVQKNAKRYPTPSCKNNMNLFSCTIKLINLSSDDFGGKFVCETQTRDRRDILEKKIDMKIPPEIGLLIPSYVVLAKENETVTATCLVRLGYPRAESRSLDFEKKSGAVKKKNDPEIMDINGFKWVLLRTTKTLTAEDQGDMLVCKASNTVSTVFKSSIVLVKLPVYNMTITPSSNSSLKRQQTFACSVYGYPQPSIELNGKIRDRKFTGDLSFSKPYIRLMKYSTTIYPDDDIIITCSARNTVDGKIHTLEKTVTYRGSTGIY